MEHAALPKSVDRPFKSENLETVLQSLGVFESEESDPSDGVSDSVARLRASVSIRSSIAVLPDVIEGVREVQSAFHTAIFAEDQDCTRH